MARGGGIALLVGVVVGGVALAGMSGKAKADEPPTPPPKPDGGNAAFDLGYQDGYAACAGATDGTMDPAKAKASGDGNAYTDGWNAGCMGSQKPATDDLLPGTTTKKSRVRAIEKDTGTPSQFAQKWSGTAARWTEIPGANPSGTIYPGSPAIISKTIFTLDVDPATGDTLPSGKNVTGLQPWMLGQLVKLPDTWTG